jgi:hypothetical protein
MTDQGFKSKRHKSNQTFGAKLRDAVETHEENWVSPTASQAEKPQGPNSQQKGLQSQVRKDAVETHEKQKNWATPNICGNHNRKGASKTSGDGLSTQVKNWATPQTFDHVNIVRTPEKLAQTRAEKNAGCMDHSRKAAQNWPTPTAVNRVRDEETMEKCLKFRQSNGQTSVPLYLEEKVIREPQNWPTATTRDWKDTNATVPPSRANPSKQTLGQRVAHVGLQDQANLNTNGKSQESWSTPQARDWKGAEGRAYKGQTKDLPAQTQAMGKLNPDWVEHLMGLPVGWTDLGSWETE